MVGKKGAEKLGEALFASEKDFALNTEFFLCFLTLERFIEKLMIYSKGFSLKKEMRIALNQREALAFHIAFRRGFIDTTEVQVNEIFTAIDRTL